mgnify:CR=1 FL=1
MTQIQTILPRSRYALSPDQDLTFNIELNQSGEIIQDNNITNYLDQATRFNEERQQSNNYRIFGNFNYNSPFRHLSNQTQLNEINSIKSLFDLSVVNYNDIGFRFEEYFDLMLVYPYKYKFISEIDENISLYNVIYKKIKDSDTYQYIKSGFQLNAFNQIVFNVIPNKHITIVDVSGYGLTTIIDNLYNISGNTIEVPITELKLYIKPKPIYDDFNIKLKVFDENYNGVNLNLSTNLTFGFDDNGIDYNHYDPTDNINSLLLANIKQNNNDIDVAYGDAEFLMFFRKKILLFLKLNDIAITVNNILLSMDILRKYVGFGDNINGVTINDFNQNDDDNNIIGELISLNKNDYTINIEDEQSYILPFKYNYKTDPFYGQIIKEVKGLIEDFINNTTYYKTTTLNGYSITYYGIDEANQNLFVKFKCYDSNNIEITSTLSNYIDVYVNTYEVNKNNYTNRLLLNKISNKGYYPITNELYFNLTKNYDIDSLDYINIKYRYNPFGLTIPLKYFKSSIETTINANEASMYAYKHNGLWKWKELLENGQIEQQTEIGADYPFINNTHYIDNNFILNVMVDNSDYYTNKIYSLFNSNEIGIVGYDNPNQNLNEGVC